MSKTALITGITGQDGTYLTELLISKGYTVHGLKRRAWQFNTKRLNHILKDPLLQKSNPILQNGDITDSLSITRIIQEVRPDEIYNLGAMSHVKGSFESPEYTADSVGLGALRILEAVRFLGLAETTRIYQASSSALYGLVSQVPQYEKTPFYPKNPYGVAKLYAYWITVSYREAYGMHASNGIMFNHESPIRGESFVTRKITRATARIALGLQDYFAIGNMNTKRDWGHAKDYVEAMYLILQQDKPDDYVVATGITTEVRDFVRKAFKEVGLTLEFRGKGEDEIAVIKSVNEAEFIKKVGESELNQIFKRISSESPVIKVDPKYYRPAEAELLIGNPAKAKKMLGWEPKYNLSGLIKDMMKSDIHVMKKASYLMSGGYETQKYFD